MKTIQMYLLLLFNTLSYSQINIWPVSQVSDTFKQQYFSKKRDYNPLQVGNVWQYHDDEYNTYVTTRVVEDSLINGKIYFKKINYQNNPPTTNFVSWERNDTTSGISFMLDFQDVNNNGDSTDELSLDSLELPVWSLYYSYKYSFSRPNPFTFFPGLKRVFVVDSNWCCIEGDTVMSRRFNIFELFWLERIIEKFGIFSFMLESPIRFCNGAIINGRQYGTIVDIKDAGEEIPNELTLGSNYPNPFNSSTTINFRIPGNNQYFEKNKNVKLIVYDALGGEISILFNEIVAAGEYSITFNAQDLSSGVYFYTLISDLKIISKPMLLIK